MHFGIISYASGALSFFILFLLLLTSWRGRVKGSLLVLAVLTSVAWAACAALYINTNGVRFGQLYSVLEVLRSAMWLILLYELLKPLLAHTKTGQWTLFYPGLATYAVLLSVVELFPNLLGATTLSIQVTMLGHIGLALLGMIMIEQLFRNTKAENRWSTKFLYFGIGTLFAYDFFLYADALLLYQINIEIWSARGMVNALIVPLIAVSAARNPQWSLDIFVSRRIVIHSVAIVGAGLYLLAMAGAGYYIRYFGGSWGSAIQLVFLVAAGLLLAVMLFSGQLRSIIAVFFSKHFFNYKYDYRDEWLRFNDTLSPSKSPAELREGAIQSIAEILHSPAGLLWSKSNSGHFALTAHWNIPESGARIEAADSPLVSFLEKQQWVIDIIDYEKSPDSYPDIELPQWLQKIPNAWVIAPLLQGHELRGFIVLTKSRAFQKLNWEDWDLVKTAGRQVASHIALLDATEALMDARQFDAFNRLSAYVVHDLKNVAAQLALVVKNAERHKANPAFVEDAFTTVANATAKMERMLAQLRKGTTTDQAARTFNVNEAIADVVAARQADQPQPQLKLPAQDLFLHANHDRFTSVIEHLIQNAQEASPDDGEVCVVLQQNQGWLMIEVTDNGSGMTPEFIRERLFRPFQTTKGNAGMGIGVYESREFVHALSGEISVDSTLGNGTTFAIKLPMLSMANIGDSTNGVTLTQNLNPAGDIVACAKQIGNY